jgi:pimeloyl-ACP methyl ester carboxylesterase
MTSPETASPIDAPRIVTMLNRAGNRITVESAGPETGATVVLLHGGGQTRHSWGTALSAFARAGYRTIAYDARGHGQSDWDPAGDYSFGALARDLEDVLAGAEGRIALVGASMGGITAYRAIAERLVDAAALVLVDIVPNPVKEGGQRIAKFMTSNRDGFATLEEAGDAVAEFYPERPRPKDISGLRKNLRLRSDGRFGWHWDPRLFGDRPTSEPPDIAGWAIEMAPSVTVPLLLVRGGDSDVVDADSIAETKRLLPQTEVFEVAGAGHMIVGDKNDAFNEGVLTFIAREMPAS